MSLFAEHWEEFFHDFLYMELDYMSMKRAVTYVQNNHVSDIKLLGDDCKCITAVSRGSGHHRYQVEIHANGNHDCSCPVGSYCKHVAAVMMTIVEIGKFLGSEFIYHPLPKTIPRGVYDSNRPPHKSLLDAVAPLFAAEVIELESDGRRWFDRFLELEEHSLREKALFNKIRHMIPPHLHLNRGQLSSITIDLLQDENPVRVLEAFEAKTKKHLGRHAPPPDPDLAEFLQQPHIQQIKINMDQEIAWTKVSAWIEKGAQKSTSTLADAGTRTAITAELNPTSNVVNIPHLTCSIFAFLKTKGLSIRTMHQIQMLMKEYESGRRLLPETQGEFITWLTAQPVFNSLSGSYSHNYWGNPFASLSSDLTSIPVLDVLSWHSLWGTENFLSVKNVGPLNVGLRLAHLTFDPQAEDPRWEVAIPADTPARIRFADAVIFTDYVQVNRNDYARRPLLLHEGVIYRLNVSGMDIPTLENFRRMDMIPIERLRKSTLGEKLVRRLKLEKTDPERFAPQEVPVRPILEFRHPDGKSVLLHVRAESTDGAVFERLSTGEWLRQGVVKAPKATDPAVLERIDDQPGATTELEAPTAAEETTSFITMPRAADLELIGAWLEKVIPPFADEERRDGRVHLSWKPAPLAMLEQWMLRPANADYYSDDAFKKLVTIPPAPKLTLKVDQHGVDWLSVSIKLENELKKLSIDDIVSALKADENAKLIRLPGGQIFRREELEEYQESIAELASMGLEAVEGKQSLHVMQLSGFEKLSKLDTIDEGRFAELVAKGREMSRKFKGIPDSHPPAEVANWLRPYQKVGVDFLCWASKTFGGALLADDMGLGKTLQVLSAIATLKQDREKANEPIPPSLIICPASVAHNWQREAARFTPHLRVIVLESGAHRTRVYSHLHQYDIVITNYALARRDHELLGKIEWFLACIDEAQAIKNPVSDIARTVKLLKASYRVALTGTPIENRLADLWSIVDFVVPNYLPGRLDFETRLKEDPFHSFRRLRSRLKPLMLRRMKSEVAPELPPRIEERIDCTMTPKQKKAYLAEVKKTRLLLEGFQDAKLGGQSRIVMLAALTRLRQICCDPELVGIPDTGSGKLVDLQELVANLVEAGHKILLFSQFVRALKKIESILTPKGITTWMLTGETRNRQELVEGFEKDPKPGVFLISLKAGGTGLNLVSATHVILFDPWWNPAAEAQAIDRTHRIGQTKTVLAFRMVTEGTVEERILELQEKKRDLMRGVMEEEAFNGMLSRDDFQFLLDD